MKIQHKTSLSIFVFGITFFLITTVIYTFINREQKLEEAKQVSNLHLNEATEHIETHIGEQISIAKTLANSWALKKELNKSNKMLGKLGSDERADLIKSLNDRWMATKDINDPYIQSYMASTAARVLKEHVEIFPGIVGEAFITDYYGKVIGTTNKLTTVAHAHKYWWREGFNNAKGKVFIDDRGFDDSVGGYVLGVVVPVFEDEKVIGILKININIAEHMKHVVFLHEEANSGEISIVRSLGKIVYEKGKEPLSSSIDKRIVEQFSRSPKGNITLNVGGNKLQYSYSLLPLSAGSDKVGFGGTKKSIDHRGGNVGEGWHVVIVRNYDDILEGVTSTDRLIIIYGIVISIIMGFLALLFGKALSKPIEIISDAAGKIGEGNFNIRVGINRDDEIGKLAGALNSMAANLSSITASRDELDKEVSERKKAEKTLEESEQRFRTLIEQSNTAIAFSRGGIRLFVNKAFSDLFGYGSPEELIGNNISEVISPECREAILEKNTKREQGEDLETLYESIGYMKDGTRFPIEINVTSLTIDGNLSTLVYISDISYRKEAEERFRLLTDASQEGVCLHDKGIIIDGNNKFVEIFGWDSLENMLGMSVLELASEDTRHIVLDNVKKGYEEPYEVKALKKDGTTSPIIIHGKKYFHKGEIVRVATVRDISKEKDAEDKIKKSLKEKEVLLKEIHHRVKNNMAIISSLLSLQEARTENKESIEILKDFQNRIRTMALVHEKLLSSDDFGEIRLREYISSLAKNIISSFSDSATHMDCKLDIEQVSLDMDRLIPFGLILNEAITNTVKHAFKGIEHPVINLKVTKNEKDFTLSIEDNGVGIAEGVDMLKSKSLGGKIIIALVKQLKGKMQVDSGKDGTSIRITCPI